MKKNPYLIAAVGITLAINAAYAWLLSPYIIDDAYITFAYSKHFAQTGHLLMREGLNVEATSSPLWALLLGILGKFGDIPALSIFLGFACGAAASALAAVMLLKEEKSWKIVIPVSIAVACTFSFGLWTNYGMENGLVLLLILAAACCLPKDDKKTHLAVVPLIILALFASRPEAFGYIAVLYTAETLRRIIYFKRTRDYWAGMLISVALIVLYLGLQKSYYGVWLPDSAMVKLNGSLVDNLGFGLSYSLEAANFASAWVVPVAGLLLFFDIVSRRLNLTEKRDAMLLLAGCASLSTIPFVLYAGGDWMPAARFYAIATPFSAGYIVWSLLRLKPLSNGIAAGVLTLLLLFSQSVAAMLNVPFVEKLQAAEDRALQAMVTDLNDVAIPADTLALSDIGRAAYGFKGQVFDWWGLASRLVSSRHEALGGISSRTVLEVNPEFLVIYANTEDGPSNLIEPQEMAITSARLANASYLMSRYCRLGAYYFWEGRYTVLLARRDVFDRIRQSPVASPRWETSQCVAPVLEARQSGWVPQPVAPH
jgi:hypothetical protein